MNNEEVTQEYEGFVIDNDNKAEWALKKIKEAEEEHDRLQMLIDKEISALKDKQEKIDVQLDSATGYLKHMLNQYMESVKCKQTKTQKTYQLLSGKLVHKFGGTEFIKDDEALLEWCKQNNPLLIKTKFSVDWAELKKTLVVDSDGYVINEFGEIIDCIKAEKKPDGFDIKW